MSLIAIAVKHLMLAGVTGDALVTAIADMESAIIPKKSAGATRQERYRNNLEERNKVSQNVTNVTSDASPPNGSDGFPHPSLTSLSPHKENTPKGVQKKVPHQEIILPPWLPLPEWEGFKEMRLKIRKPMTTRAERLAIGKLERFMAQGHDPGEILNQSIMNDYQDLYEPKEKYANTGKGNARSGKNGIQNGSGIQSDDNPRRSKWDIEADRLATKYREEEDAKRQGNPA